MYRLAIALQVFSLLAAVSMGHTAPAADAAVMQWHPLELAFSGPETSEQATPNPFTDYRLTVRFRNGGEECVVQGFYAADGDAAETGADAGSVWKARFTPDRLGDWTYEASLRRGDEIAIDDDPDAGEPVALEGAKGSFTVVASDKAAPDFRATGRIVADGGYFRFGESGPYWLKVGAGSPENLLGYADFDGTRREGLKAARPGESKPTTQLHRYEPHVGDWRPGDPVWRGDRGKGIVGAMNYLASEGMNSCYLITMNIGGDGKDVWPYTDYDERRRFDCSKLDQWEIVFRHMQRRGILLHVITQETENETLLDGGDTGPERKLYYRELIARFGHHPGLVWNLGEENGPVKWSPVGQSSEQQKAMADYLAAKDPYGHPIVIHTHATIAEREELLPPLLGHPTLDGISLQSGRRERARPAVERWRRESAEAGREWLVTFDEIGSADRGAAPDAADPTHDTDRRYGLWGPLFGGAAGVEWYFGYRLAHNDLNAEDWRSRDALWDQTRHALTLFRDRLPYWEMLPRNEVTTRKDDFCFVKPGEVYAVYSPDSITTDIDLRDADGEYSVRWYDPIRGGELRTGSRKEVSGGGWRNLGEAPELVDQDWVVLVERK